MQKGLSVMAKKKLISEQEQVDAPVTEASAAAETLAPNSRPSSGPESRFEAIAQMIGAAMAMCDDDLTKWHNDSMSRAAEIGHGVGIPDGAAAKNAGTITTHPSDAQGSSSDENQHEEVDMALKAAISDDLAKVFDSDTQLSEEFKTKAATLFEAAINTRIAVEVAKIEEDLNNQYEVELTESVDVLAESVEKYLDYIAGEWLAENEVAVESALRNEITTDFIRGIKDVFEGYIDVPEDQVDVVDQLASSVDDLEDRLNDEISENADLKGRLQQYEMNEAFEQVSDGLTVVERERLKELAQNIDAEDLEQFTDKVKTLKESTFVKTGEGRQTLSEQLEEVDEDNRPEAEKTYSSPQMKRYTEAIKRTVRA